MKKAVTFAICGFGSRGCDAYAVYQRRYPEDMKLVAVADPREIQRKIAIDTYDVPAENCFATGEELLDQPKMADVMIIATQDKDHYRYAIPALEKATICFWKSPSLRIWRSASGFGKRQRNADGSLWCAMCCAMRRSTLRSTA